MKIIRVERLIDAGTFSSSNDWKLIESHIYQAIKAMEWPKGQDHLHYLISLGNLEEKVMV